jgi:drug/metabolite transporter (DMT)-like permease
MRDVAKGYLFCLLGVFTWSFSEVFVKKLQNGVGPISLSFLRFFIGGIFLIPLMLIQRDTKDVGGLVKRNFKTLIIASMIGLGISNIIYFIGVQMTNANTGAALYSTYPLFVNIYSIFILKERTNLKIRTIGYVIGFLGMIILITNFDIVTLFQSGDFLGKILVVSGGAIWGIYSVLGKKIFRAEKGITNVEIKFTMISFLLASLPIIIILSFTSEIQDFLQYTSFEWMIILILACFSTGFGLFVFFIGVRKLDVSQGMSMALMKPIMAAIIAFIILDELPTPALITSIIMVSIAVLLINKPAKKTNNNPVEKKDT